MAMLRLLASPLRAPDGEDLPPQDRATWSRLRIDLDEYCLTRARGDSTDAVEGPTAGLAEWIVECWPWIFWEVHTPFPKPGASIGGPEAVPSLQDAAGFWQAIAPAYTSVLGAWQHRHTLGHGTSDLAVPSLLFVSDLQVVGVVVSELPSKLDPDVRFQMPPDIGRQPVWIGHDDLAFVLRSFVESVIARANRAAAARAWAEWLDGQFRSALREAALPESRRRWLLGPVAAESWGLIERSYGRLAGAIEGVAIDSREFKSREELTRVAECLRPRSRRRSAGAWTSIAAGPSSDSRPFNEGYALAHRVRSHLNRPEGPLDLNEALERLEVELAKVEETASRFAPRSWAMTWGERESSTPSSTSGSGALHRATSPSPPRSEDCSPGRMDRTAPASVRHTEPSPAGVPRKPRTRSPPSCTPRWGMYDASAATRSSSSAMGCRRPLHAGTSTTGDATTRGRRNDRRRAATLASGDRTAPGRVAQLHVTRNERASRSRGSERGRARAQPGCPSLAGAPLASSAACPLPVPPVASTLRNASWRLWLW